MAFIKDFLAGLALMLVVIEPASSVELSDGLSAYRRGNYSTAATKLMPIAARGIPEAQTALGFMYEYGRGVPQDAELAAQWYRCAADQGNAGSLYQLGLMHDKGHGVPRSAVIAYELLNLAAARARPTITSPVMCRDPTAPAPMWAMAWTALRWAWWRFPG